MAETFDLVTTYLQADDGPVVRLVPVDSDFWEKIAERTDLHGGRLIGVFRYASDWGSYEMHPEGDEIVYVLSGAIELVLDREAAGEQVIVLGPRQGAIVPRAVWHTANVREAGDVLHVTRGAGTQHRARERTGG